MNIAKPAFTRVVMREHIGVTDATGTTTTGPVDPITPEGLQTN
jgi:hypothetical protein